MQWLIANWFWMLIGVAFIAMHLFGHGGHGGHGGHRGAEGRPGVSKNDEPRGSSRARLTGSADPEESTARGVSRDSGGHQH